LRVAGCCRFILVGLQDNSTSDKPYKRDLGYICVSTCKIQNNPCNDAMCRNNDGHRFLLLWLW